MSREQVNRLKIVLAEEQKSNKWLAEQLGKDQATINVEMFGEEIVG